MEKLIHYLNQSPTVFFILKKETSWKLEYVTENVKNIYGFSAEDFLTNKVKHENFIHEDDLEQFTNEAKQISKTIKDTYTYKPYRIINNNSIVWVNHITKIIRDKNSNVSHYYGYLTDISLQKQLYSKLELTQNILDSIFNNSSNIILLLDNKGNIIKVNNTLLDTLHLEESQILGKSFSELSSWNKNEKERIKDELKVVLKGSCLKNKKSYVNVSGNKIYLDFSYSPIFDNNEEVTYVVCEGNDITQSELTHKNLERYVKIINENVFISITDSDGVIIDASDAYCKFTGYLKSELVGKKHNIFKHPDNDEYIFQNLWETITLGNIWKGEHQNIKKDGSMFWVENSITPKVDEEGNTIYTSIYNDITDKKKISKLLITDYLTKIYNRRHFNTVFDLELKRNKRDKKTFILMILDIDYFKQYNDTYGHDAGDKALYQVAQALKYTLKRSQDFTFRLGGEEFGVITSGIKPDGVITLANRLRQSVENLQIEHKNSDVNDFITISVGIKLVTFESSLVPNEIYKLADEALYEAKRRGRNTSVLSC